MQETKKCKKCNRILPLTKQYYPPDKGCKDGFRNVCRECQTGHYSGFLPDGYEKPPRWTKEEKQLLIDNYKDHTNLELQNLFFNNRTILAINSQAKKLEIGGKTTETYWREHIERENGLYDTDKVEAMPQEWRDKLSGVKKAYYSDHDGTRKGMPISDVQRELMKMRREGMWVGDQNPRHIHPLTGEENGRWKGGVNPVYDELRSEISGWQQKSMEFCGYKCVITSSIFHHIHHIIPFHKIISEAFEIAGLPILSKVMDYNPNDFKQLRALICDLHIKYGYGACLNRDVHKLFHDEYGYMNFTLLNFMDFINKIEQGYYNNWFETNNYDIIINRNFIDYLSRLQQEQCDNGF